MADETIEIEKAAALAEKGNPALDVRQWLHQSGHGTLATVNARKKLEGFPLGSIVPFSLDDLGRPIILIASIAAHTRNLKADNRASLFVHDPHSSGDPQKSWRASLIGRFKQLVPLRERSEEELPDYAEEISNEQWDEIMARYSQRVPDAPGYMQTHGFAFWRMSDMETIRYIAGFGRICWVNGEKYVETVKGLAFTDMEQGAMAHMNDDHVENMVEMCRGHYQIDPDEVKMVGLDIGGFLLHTKGPEGLHYFAFESLVEQADEYKTQIIRLLAKARAINRERLSNI